MTATEPHVLIFGASGSIGSAISAFLEEVHYKVATPTRAECNFEDVASVARYLSNYTSVPSSIVFAAGVNFPQNLPFHSTDNFVKTMQVNTHAALQIFSYFAPLQVTNGGGANVVISSLYSQLSRQGRAAYSASKAALEAMARSFALEYGNERLRFNIVQPGFIDTPLTQKNNTADDLAKLIEKVPLGRLGSPSEIAKVVRFLVSPESSYVTGATLRVDGGFSLG